MAGAVSVRAAIACIGAFLSDGEKPTPGFHGGFVQDGFGVLPGRFQFFEFLEFEALGALGQRVADFPPHFDIPGPGLFRDPVWNDDF